MMAYVGWKLPESDRTFLLGKVEPKFEEVIAHHVTLKFGVKKDHPVPDEVNAVVVGEASNDGIQALVVEIDGSVNRPDGGIYHITWSLDRSKGYAPKHSNDLLQNGWESIDPLFINLEPKVFL